MQKQRSAWSADDFIQGANYGKRFAWQRRELAVFVQSERHRERLVQTLQQTVGALVFKWQMMENSQAADEQSGPVLEAEETGWPFQTSVTLLPLNTH